MDERDMEGGKEQRRKGVGDKDKMFLKLFFCSALSEFENFRLCERILINLTTCQNETSS
jgi:hypothetical protein